MLDNTLIASTKQKGAFLMPTLFPQAFAAPATSSSSSESPLGPILSIILIAWYVIWIIQAYMGYGTAYRKTKANGDNGVSLFGWMIVYSSLAAMVPGLGIYLWNKSKTPAVPAQQPMQYPQAQQYPPAQQYPQYQQNPPAQYGQTTPTDQQHNNPNSNQGF